MLANKTHQIVAALLTLAVVTGGFAFFRAEQTEEKRLETDENEVATGIEDYFDWLYENRRDGSLVAAWKDVDKMPNLNGATALWESIGPAPVAAGTNRWSGRTPSIAVDPSDPNTLYIGAALGGVWKSTDAGATWAPLTDNQPSLASGSVAVDPTDSNIVYVGTGEQDFSGDSYYGAGVLRSTDGGATWTRLGENEFVNPTGGGATISRVVIDPTSPNVVYVASNFGLFKSTDRGESWQLSLSGRSPLAAVTELVMDPSDSQTLYAGVGVPTAATNKGIYKTTDGGDSWTRLDIGLTDANIARIDIGISRSNPLILYAAVNNPALASTISRLKTTDGGSTWSRLPDCSGGGCGQGSYNLTVAVDPQNPNTVYQGAVSLFRSFDGGATWNTRASGHPDHHMLVYDSLGNLYIGSDGGVWKLTAADQLITLNTNQAVTQFYAGIALHPFNGNIAQAGAQDNGSERTTGDPTWRSICGGDGAYQAIDGPDGDPDNVWYCSSQHLGIRKTINGGLTTSSAVTGIADRAMAAFVAPYIIDPNNSQVLLAGTHFVWRTEDGAAHWVQNSPQLATGNAIIRNLAFAPLDSGTTYYAGTSAGEIWRTTDTGANWTPVNQGLPTGRTVTHIAVNPLDSNRVYATFSGFGTSHVFRSLDAGDTWENISSNLPNLPTNAVAIDGASSTLYLGTDLGVFRSLDDGASWDRFSAGLPNTRVEDLVVNPGTGFLVASTHGRGLWRLNLAAGK